MTCDKCKNNLSFQIPEDFCDEHWVDWWMSGHDGLSAKELQEERKRIRGIIFDDQTSCF